MTGRHKGYTEETVATMRRMAAEGATQATIAKAIGRTRRGTTCALAKFGIRTHGMTGRPQVREAVFRPYSEDEAAMINRMIDADCTVPQVATAANRSQGAIREFCRSRGWAIREAAQERPEASLPWPLAIDFWPAHVRFEDDPRACRPEPPFKAPPIVNFSAMGCSAAMCAGMGSQAMGGRW